MPFFYNPIWLLLLALIPVVRWIHRWHASRRRHVVPALFLWRGEPDAGGTGDKHREPDPAWRRRALATALLALALAEPAWLGNASRLTVWIDDSLSMYARDDGISRIESAFREMQRASEGRFAGGIELRSLGDPEFVRQYTGSDDVDLWLEKSPSAPGLPPGAVMARDSAHWLLTDGASGSVRQWAARVALDRIVNVGRVTENVSVVLLGARRRIDADSGLDIVVKAANLGHETQRRKLLLRADGRAVGEVSLSIEPGESIESFFQTQHLPASLTAGFQISDVLIDDDDLQLDLRALQPVRISVDPNCPASVNAVIDAHPALQVASFPAESVVDIDCDVDGFGLPEPGSRPRVRVLVDEAGPARERPAWNLPAAEFPGFSLLPEWIDAAAWPADSAHHEILLLTSQQPLVATTRSIDGITFVDTTVDLKAEAFKRQPEYALFVSGLVSRALAKPTLDDTASASRNAEQSIIAPVIVGPAASAGIASSGATETDLSRWLLLMALLVILRDSAMFVAGRPGDGNG